GQQASVGDPVVLASGATYEKHLDAQVGGAVRPLQLWRMYLGGDNGLLPPPNFSERALTAPFGKSPQKSGAVRTWHNLYSLVSVSAAAHPCVQYVRGPLGNRLDVGQNLCLDSAAGTWGNAGPKSKAARERLRWDGDGFTLLSAEGAQLRYGAIYK